MKKIATIEIKATPMILEGSWGTRDLGAHASTMELWLHDDSGKSGLIEWDIPTLQETTQIGVMFDGRTLRDYDGTHSLPREAVKFLRSQGYRVPKRFT